MVVYSRYVYQFSESTCNFTNCCRMSSGNKDEPKVSDGNYTILWGNLQASDMNECSIVLLQAHRL